MLYWLTFAASLLTLCTALPSPLAEPQNRRTTYTSRRYSQDPVRAEVAGILTTFAPGSDQRDYIFIFNGYDSNDRLIRQNGCYHDTQRNNPVVYCLDAQAYDGGTIVTDPRRGEAAFASIRRFRDFMFSYEDDVAPRYRTPQFETRTMRPTILTDIRPGKYLDFDFRVELLNGYVFFYVFLLFIGPLNEIC